MFRHVTIKLAILLILLLLLAVSAPLGSAQTASGKAVPNSIPQVTIPGENGLFPAGQFSHQFKIRPAPRKSNEVDLGKVIMAPRNPNTVYIDPRLKLLWFRRDHEALALDFKIKARSKNDE